MKIGRDDNNFYFYRTPVNAGLGQAAWLPEVVVDFDQLNALRLKLQNAYLQNSKDTLSCTGVDSALIAQSVLPGGPGLAPVRGVRATATWCTRWTRA